MNRTYLFLIAIIGLVSCGHPDSYIHTFSDKSGIKDLTVTYIGSKAEIVAFNKLYLMQESTHFDGPVELVIVTPSQTMKFPDIAQKYFNMEGNIEITTNIYHDYFPEEWSPLKQGGDYLTYSFYGGEDRLFFIVFNLASGAEIGSYFEYE